MARNLAGQARKFGRSLGLAQALHGFLG